MWAFYPRHSQIRGYISQLLRVTLQRDKMCQGEKDTKQRDQEEVEEKLGRTTRYMEQVRDIGTTNKESELSLVKRRLLQIVSELEDIREDLVYMVRDQLSPRQLDLLLETNDDEAVDADPSIQFFGVEWNSVFARCFGLGLNMRIFKQRHYDGFVDVTGLACLLSDIAWVRRQMELHSVALSSGVTSQAYLARQLQLQLQVTQAGEEKKVSRGAVRYSRKHKTENLDTKISRSEEEQRRKSVCTESNPRKKSSFLGNVSSLLNYVKKN